MLRMNYCVQVSPLFFDILPSCVNRTYGVISFIFTICNMFVKVDTAYYLRDFSQTPSPEHKIYIWRFNPGQHPQWWMWPERCYTWGLVTPSWFSKHCLERNIQVICLWCFNASSHHGKFSQWEKLWLWLYIYQKGTWWYHDPDWRSWPHNCLKEHLCQVYN